MAVSADDICAAAANPCVVAQAYEVLPGAVLDFGLRTLRIEGSGLLEFASGDSTLACGRLEVATAGIAIRARATDPIALSTITLLARRRCALSPANACFVDADCAAAGGGGCSAGDGRVVIDGPLSISGENPGRIVLRAAGDLSVSGAITATGTRTSSDGGSVELESTAGSILVMGALDASGGGGGGGGDVSLVAGGDIEVRERVIASGGEYDGGSVAMDAARSVTITADVLADSLAGAGFGGEIEVSAGATLTIAGGTASSNLVLGTDGHQSLDNYGGDGGTQSYEAGGDLVVSRYVRFRANAAAPDGFADTLTFSAEGNLTFDGSVIARGRGTYGGGALVDLIAAGDIRASETALFDLSGPAAGGDLMIDGGAALVFAADVDVSSGVDGLGGRVVAVAAGDADVSGHWRTSGAQSTFSVGDLFLEGCQVRMSGLLSNTAEAGRNRIVAHESLSIPDTGSLLASGPGGTNSLQYRHAERPPLVSGRVSPLPALTVDAGLAACSGCGDAALEAGESCDDGNFCTVADSCVDGACTVAATSSLAVPSLKMRVGRDPGQDRALWKTEFPIELLAAAPSAVDLRLVLTDGFSRPLVDTTLPAGSYRGEDPRWRYAIAPDVAAVGIVKSAIEVDGDAGVIRARFKMRGMDLAEAVRAGTLSLALLVGDDPGEALCTSSRPLDCEHGRRSVSCSSNTPLQD